MRLRNTPMYFSSPFKLLHWTTAALVISQYVIIWLRDAQPEGTPARLQYMLWHKSIGITLFACVLLLATFRRIGKRPAALPSMPRWERWASNVTHGTLYFLVLGMPLSGYLMSTFGGYDLRWFGYLLPKVVWINKDYSHWFHDAHIVGAYILMATVSLHFLAAIKHHFWDKDRILTRMLPAFSEKKGP